jgi:hypothetical protein
MLGYWRSLAKNTFGNASRLAFFPCKDTNGNSKSASLRVYSMGWDENGMGGFCFRFFLGAWKDDLSIFLVDRHHVIDYYLLCGIRRHLHSCYDLFRSFTQLSHLLQYSVRAHVQGWFFDHLI